MVEGLLSTRPTLSSLLGGFLQLRLALAWWPLNKMPVKPFSGPKALEWPEDLILAAQNLDELKCQSLSHLLLLLYGKYLGMVRLDGWLVGGDEDDGDDGDDGDGWMVG